MKEGKFVFSLASLMALFFGFGSHVLGKLLGRDFGNDMGFVYSALLAGFFLGVILAVLKTPNRS